MARETQLNPEWIKAYQVVCSDIEDLPAEALDEQWVSRYLLEATRHFTQDMTWELHEIQRGLQNCLARFRRDLFNNQNNIEALKVFMLSKTAQITLETKKILYSTLGIKACLQKVVEGFVILDGVVNGFQKESLKQTAMEMILEGHIYAMLIASNLTFLPKEQARHQKEWLQGEHSSIFYR